jgi:hypothetical protein
MDNGCFCDGADVVVGGMIIYDQSGVLVRCFKRCLFGGGLAAGRQCCLAQ